MSDPAPDNMSLYQELLAVSIGVSESVEMLLDAGADPSIQVEEEGRFFGPVHEAAGQVSKQITLSQNMGRPACSPTSQVHSFSKGGAGRSAASIGFRRHNKNRRTIKWLILINAVGFRIDHSALWVL